MKTILILSIVCISVISNAQEWRRYHRNGIGLTYGLTASDFGEGGRRFRINPYDNSLWMANGIAIQTISSNGETAYFSPFTHFPAFQSSSRWATFEFLPGKVFALDEHYGLFVYENETWSSVYNPSGFSYGMAKDRDTFYILRNNQPFVKWFEGTSQPMYNSGTTKRIVANNNRFWLSRGFSGTGLGFYSEMGIYSGYSQSNSLWMDNVNFDFKFSPHHDTLYVAGNKGLSLLHNLAFFDSIAPDNTTNMPTGVILDFEFDASDNIWALFGSNAQTPTAVAHYDQPSKTWDAYYDASNSDLNFSTYCSIEMDTFGNLWMVNQNYIHVLELGELPVWLSAKQPSMQSTVSVYPNPATEFLYIESDLVISEIHLTDQMGKQVKKLNPKETAFSVAELPSGIYFVELVSEAGEKRTLKVVKE